MKGRLRAIRRDLLRGGGRDARLWLSPKRLAASRSATSKATRARERAFYVDVDVEGQEELMAYAYSA